MRNFKESLILVLMAFSAHAWSASVIHSYDAKGKTIGILGITGITEESSLRCRSDKSLICRCTPALYSGTVAQLEYHPGLSIASSFILETSRGAVNINVEQPELSKTDATWVPTLLKRGEKLLVVAELCGVSGRDVQGREIFSARMLSPASRKGLR